MQGLVTNLASGFSATESASPALNSPNSAVNSASAGNQAPSALFSNLLASAAQSEQTQFQPGAMNAAESSALLLERQLLPPGMTLASKLAAQGDETAQPPLMDDGALLNGFDASKQVLVTPGIVAENMIRPQELAAQIGRQGQNRLQQDLMMRQLTIAPLEAVDGDLAGSRLAPLLENSGMVGGGAQLSNMLRDAMLLKQQPSGAENKMGDAINAALGNLTMLAGETKGSGEPKSLMQASINTPFSQQAVWGEELGSRVKWMVNSQVQSAELKMNPANLGPIEVKISVQNDQTTIYFSAQNGAVREALDTAMPRLREMLGESGVNLVDVDVSDQSFAQQQKAFEQENDAMGDEYASGDELDGDDREDLLASDEGEMLLLSKIVDYYA